MTEYITFEHNISPVPSNTQYQEREVPFPTFTFPEIDHNWNSLFIPMLPGDLIDEERLKYLIEFVYGFGKIKRIDFTKKENSNNKYMAFIHFEYWNNNEITQSIRARLEYYNVVDLNYMGYNDNKIKFIRFMINKTPIKETEMNPHQLANEIEIMKKTVSEKDNEIAELQRKIKELTSENIKLHHALSINESILEESNLSENNDEWYDIREPIKLTRQTNAPVNIVHVLHIEFTDSNTLNLPNLLYNDEYVHNINMMIFHLLNIETFKKINNINSVSVLHIVNNIFAIKFNTTNNIYSSLRLSELMYNNIINHIENNLKIEKKDSIYDFKLSIVYSKNVML